MAIQVHKPFSWQSALLGLGALIGGLVGQCAAARAACVAGPAKEMAAPTGYYDSYNSGDVVVGWTRAVVHYYTGCEPRSSAEMIISPTSRFVGIVDGYSTFSTEHDGIGVQVDYRYIRSILDSGQPEYSDWQMLSSAGTRIVAHAEYIRDNPVATLPVEVDYRFVALRDFSGESILMGYFEPLSARDLSYGQSLNQLTVEGVRQRPREEASCSFSAAPPANLELPRTSITHLKNTGDVGPAADFSFAWRCRAGNQGHSGRADFEFLSDAAIAATPGHLSTTGGAEGVDMLVTIEYPDGSQRPVVFGEGEWYANRLSPGTGGLPSSGSQNMQVRFIRNANPLLPGLARSTMTIHLVPF
ncbi:hypothetical protein GUV60_03790 [Stenotrophomonas maltophilia]|nr:hypothetical protein [Stenotrophomonas maltophilia]